LLGCRMKPRIATEMYGLKTSFTKMSRGILHASAFELIEAMG
jgi:hypothetical protein